MGHQRVICVMNEHYGPASRDSLPFDLSHVRWPTRYSLAEDASPEIRKEERRKLVAALSTAVRASLGTIAPPIVGLPLVFPAQPSKTDIARFREPDDALGFVDGR